MARKRRPAKRKRPAASKRKARRFFTPPVEPPRSTGGDRPGRKVLAESVKRSRHMGRSFFTPGPEAPPPRDGIIKPGGMYVQDFLEKPDRFMIIEGGLDSAGSFYIERHRMRPELDAMCETDPEKDPRLTHWAFAWHAPEGVLGYCRICQREQCRGITIARKILEAKLENVTGGMAVFQRLLGLGPVQERIPF